MDNQKNSFLIHLDTCQHLVPLSMEQRGRLISGLIWFAGELNARQGKLSAIEALEELEGLLPETRMAFSFMAASVARDYEKWHEKKTNYQAAAKRRQTEKQAMPFRGRGIDLYPTKAEQRALLGED